MSSITSCYICGRNEGVKLYDICPHCGVNKNGHTFCNSHLKYIHVKDKKQLEVRKWVFEEQQKYKAEMERAKILHDTKLFKEAKWRYGTIMYRYKQAYE
jgi:uncharacterized Zn finger protein (UPF0148 family)